MDSRRCSWAVLPLRLAFGFGMAFHGFPKVFTREEHDQFVGSLAGMHLPAPDALGWALGGLELFGGILIMLGALTALLSALFIIEMLVAAAFVHLPNGFSFMHITGMSGGQPVFGMPGYEVNVLYIAGFLALLIGGAGRYSVDGWRRRFTGSIAQGDAAPAAQSPFAGRAPTWRRRAPQTPPAPPPP